MLLNKKILTFTLFVCILYLYAGIGYAQYKQQPRYLPQYNLWLPGNSVNHQNLNIEKDSVFNWQYVQTPVYFYIADVMFIDSLCGWAAHTAGGVLRTTDSGYNWDTTQFVPGFGSAMNGISFINKDTGWSVGGMGRIRKTINGGIEWKNQDYLIYDADYKSGHFFDANTGIIIGSKSVSFGYEGYVIKTTNGGDNWSEMYLYSQQYTELMRQFWINPDTGWFCGSDILLKTTNGGSTYIDYFSTVPPTQNGHNGFLDIYFISENIGWLCGSNWDNKNIYKTTNGGFNWFFQDNPVAYYEPPQINGIIFISSDTGWASSYVGMLIVTTNGGINWVVDKYTDETTRFSSYNNSKIWCGSAHGRIWYTLVNNPVEIIREGNQIPKESMLYQNYPNPFNPVTNIKYDLPKSGDVSIKVYDILGKEIYSMNEFKLAGSYSFKFDGTNFASGVYFYRIETANFVSTKKMVLIK